ncbi:hypothetical protein pb186bvf_011352 [Paramecium bursaria]
MCLSIATDAICCAGSSFCSIACCCCQNMFGTSFKEQIKIAYIFMNTIVMGITVLVLYYIQSSYSNYVKYIGCPIQTGGSDYCLGVSGVYRMSFSLACIYFVLMFCMLFRGRFAKEINEGLWIIKIGLIIGIFYTSLYIPNSFFETYVEICIVFSSLYLLFQIVMFIDIFYMWAENWVAQYQQGIEGMGLAMVIASISTFAGAFTLIVYNYIWFSSNQIIVTITLIMIAVMTIIQLQGYNQSGSLITSGSVALYMSFQCYSALSSWPNFYDSKNAIITQMIVGLLLNLIALTYMIFATQDHSQQQLQLLESKKDKQQDKQQLNGTEVQPIEIELTYDQKIREARALLEKDELLPYQSNQYVVFHILMIIISMYLAMMITNWGAPNITAQTKDAYQPSNISYVIKIIMCWSSGLVYIWTLVAPRLFPDRFTQQ